MGVVATGGLAPLFDGATDVIDKVDPDLTLWGLRLIYQRQQQPMNRIAVPHRADDCRARSRRALLPAARRRRRDRDEPQPLRLSRRSG